MTKADLIAKISNENGLSKAVAAKVLNSILEGVGEALKNGDPVTLVGFGTFSAVQAGCPHGT